MIRKRIIGVVVTGWLALAGVASAAPQQTLAPDRVSDISNTKHNFASGGGVDLPTGQKRDMRAESQNETCVFCHTPHFANKTSGVPLWNRQLSSSTYTPYTSSSMQASPAAAPGGSSKLCLSCHDGTLAIGAVNVANGQTMGVSVNQHILSNAPGSPSGRQTSSDSISAKVGGPQFNMVGAGGDQMPVGAGVNTGFTPNLGSDLTTDHPISFLYDSALATATGEKELYVPGERIGDSDNKAIVANRLSGNQAGLISQISRPALPLENGQVECGTCHDPHIRGTGADERVNVKFLRLNRFQKASPSAENTFSIAKDINCVACHKKPGWELSAHANPSVATHKYSDQAADLREFPRGTSVWEASCLNCHDNHTIQGARRLLREGTDSQATPKSGGGAAQEETCYQCHTNMAASVLRVGGQAVADIKTAFTSVRHMPLVSTDQIVGSEVHDVTNADLEEPRGKLGKVSQGGTLNNRHVECSDCHNPHRTVKKQLFNADPSVPDQTGTHAHNSSTPHTNLASGSLKGTVGVEPTDYSGNEFFTGKPRDFDVKKGNPSVGAGTDVANSHVTREYQVCLRCHSEYAYDSPPTLAASGSGSTASGTNGMTAYTDQAMEFQAPSDHAGDNTANNSGAAAGFQVNNHRSWHPVMAATGRNAGASAYLTPFDQTVGLQTMYCSDCHGSSTGPGTVVPSVGSNWGPHGSDNDFILKGAWSGQSGVAEVDGLCSKCHNSEQYSSPAPATIVSSGFSCENCVTTPGQAPMSANLHVLHANKTDSGVNSNRCMNCHVAVPHGFKNKGLLANLNDVGPEAGLPAGTAVAAPYTNGPYYNGAKLKVVGFKASGQWVKADCTGCHTP